MPLSGIDPAALSLVTGYVPGLVGRVAEMHARYYVRQWDFTAFFETRVASEMSQFIDRYEATRDCVWSLSMADRVEATLTIDGIEATTKGAHLRWFIASDLVRGSGVGRRLIDLAMDFCRQHHYHKDYLHTFKGLEPARRLYEHAGFKLVASQAGDQWGTRVEEQYYAARL